MRWRKSDLLAVLGLLLVLAWTPQYVAQSDAEADLTWTEGFRMPYPRDGMRTELELVSQWKDGPTLSHGTIVTIEYETVDSETAPMGAVYRERIVHYAAEHDLGFAHYSSSGTPGGAFETEQSRYFDAGGGLVWLEKTYHHLSTDRSGAPYHRADFVGAIPQECQYYPPLADHAGSWKRYETDLASITLGDMWSGVRDGFDEDTACGREGGAGFMDTVNIAAEHEDLRLFGRHHVRGDRLFDHMTAGAGDPPFKTCPLQVGQPVFPDMEYGDPFFGRDEGFSLGFGGYPKARLEFSRNMTASCDIRKHFEKWDWLTPEFPIPVGHHARYWDAEGRHLFTIDVVPRSITVGGGSDLPVDSRPDWPDYQQSRTGLMERVTAEAEDTVPLTALKDDRTRLAHGLSIREVHAMVVGEDAPPALAEFARSATLAGFFWRADPPVPYAPVAGSDEEPLLPILGNRTDVLSNGTERVSTSWRSLYVAADGQVRLADVQVVESRPEGNRLVTVEDVCGWYETNPDDPWSCGKVGDLSSLDRSVVPPAMVLARGDASRPDGMGTLSEPEGGATTSFSFDPFQVIMRAYEGDGLWRGAADWSFTKSDSDAQTSVSETVSLWSGAALRQSTKESLAMAEPRGTPTPSATTIQEMRHLDVTTTTLATSGLLLVALSFLVRLGAALKSGAHYGLFGVLYAKIARDEVLVHERRQEIQEALRSEPGLTVSELSRRLGYGWGATVHHLETLKRNGLLTSVVHGRARCYFLVGEGSPLERRRFAVAKKQEYAAFLDLVASSPGLTLNELTERLPQGRSGASRTGARLYKMGLVRKVRDGKSVRFWPMEEGHGAASGRSVGAA